MKNFIAHTFDVRNEMLKAVSCASIEDLFRQIPAQFKEFNMGNPLSEMDAQKKVKALARKDKTEYACFLGGGVYNKFIPAAVNYVAQRFEFLTAYTPYQPEISQGTLQHEGQKNGKKTEYQEMFYITVSLKNHCINKTGTMFL